MDFTWWQVILMTAFGWFSTISGVLLGGYLVYRTKRDPYEPFLTLKQPEGEVFNIGEEGGIEPLSQGDESVHKVPSVTRLMTDEMKRQMKEKG